MTDEPTPVPGPGASPRERLEAVLYELAYCFDLAEADEASIVYFRNFTNDHPYSKWTARCADWLRDSGFLRANVKK